MKSACLGALLSFWRRSPLQLFTLIAGLALATALWSGVQAINAEARASYDAASATLGEGRYDQLVPRSGQSLPQKDYVALRRSGWLVTPIVEGRLNGVRIIGIEPVTAPAGFGGVGAQGAFQSPDVDTGPRLFANRETAERLAGVVELAIASGVAPGVAVGDIGAVQDLLGHKDLSRLLVLPEQPLVQPDLAEIAPHLRLQASQQVADIESLTNSFHLNLTAFGLLSFTVGLFIVHSTIGLAFEQRRGMVRTLRSLGAPLRTVIGLMVVEMGILATIGAGLGVLLGYFVAGLLMPDVAATLRGLYGAPVSGALTLRAEWWVSGMALAYFGAAVALGSRLWQVARLPVLSSAKPHAWLASNRRRITYLAVGSTLLFSLAAILTLFANTMLTAFAMLACLLIGAALALPVAAERFLAVLRTYVRNPIGAWFLADTRQQLGGLSLALMALLLAVAANVGVSTMVSSFRVTFTSFLDQRLAPELYIQVETAADSAALESWLRNEGMEILPLFSTSAVWDGRPAEHFGVRVGPTYRGNWRFLGGVAAPWDLLEQGEAVIVNEQLARRSGIWVGDMVDISSDLSLPIAAVVGDYGNPEGQVVMSETLFKSIYPASVAFRFGVRTDDPAALRSQITTELRISETAMIDQATLKRASINVFERTFVVTGALNVLTLGVAGFAILMSLLTLADQRVPQLSPVWALGMTRRRLGSLELLRAVLLATIVVIFALPLGLALAWVLLSIVNVAAFGWKLPMFLFPADYARLGALSLVAAAIAAAWPALRLARTPPSRLLKVFSNER
ncbi:MAG: FtsX-like permease family protein [Pseudomonadota bacterium]